MEQTSNSKLRILLTGYYGFGNLGDDLLFICNYRLLRRICPGAIIDVFTESTNPGYLNRLVNEEFTFLGSGKAGEYDIIWHGGGGVFFDFENGDSKSRIFNGIIKSIGPRRFANFYNWAKRRVGRPAINFKHRIGVGIGVGTFTKSSRAYRYKIQQLSTFNHLVVRDEQSLRNALSLSPHLKVSVATDIVLDSRLWLSNSWAPEKKVDGKKIGIILRDWSFDKAYNHFEEIYKLSADLEKDGYQISFFAFDLNTDKRYIDYFNKKGISVTVWNPETVRLNQFIELLSQQDAFITSRFHGAIIGACLNIPGVVLNIEPKLKAAAEMLGGCYHIAETPLNANGGEAIKILLAKISSQKPVCSNSIQLNEKCLRDLELQLADELSFFKSK